MSDASSSPDTPSDSVSPQDQAPANLEVTRITNSDYGEGKGAENEDSDESDGSVEPNEQDATEGGPDSLLLGGSVEPDNAVVVQAGLEPKPDANGQTHEHQQKEDGSVAQPYSVVDETADKNNNGDIPVPDTVIDGRVKQNPIPHKYVAKATKRDGNFRVMQMGHGRNFMDARDLAAKRSSEATQAAAAEAVRTGNNGMARRKHVWKAADANMTAAPPPQQHQHYRQPSNQYPPRSGHYAPPMGLPPGGLSLADVKSEQARLLTFLRGIHPVIVVDQLCKALAYFGGIPGAPVPQDHGAFPQSAKANGPGMLLIGWLSEIFPPADYTKPPFSNFPHNLPNMGHGYGDPLNQNGPPKPTPEPAVSEPEPPRARTPKPVDPNAPPKRKRGRPKGSKNSKFRKDKGVKRPTLTPGDVPPHPDGTPWKPGDPYSMVDLTQDTNSSLPAQTPEKTSNRPAGSQSQVDTGPGSADLSAPGPASVTPENRKRGRPFGTKTHARPVPTPNLPKLADASSTLPGPAKSPSVGVSKVTGDAIGLPQQTPQNAASWQRDASLSEHARTWANFPQNVSRETRSDSDAAATSQAAPSPADARASTAEHSQSSDSKKRKQQHSPLALPNPTTVNPPQITQHQLERPESEEGNASAQAKRRRTANGTSQTSFSTIPNPQSQASAASTNNNTNSKDSSSVLVPANDRPSDGSQKAPALELGSMQAPPPQQQHYQRSSLRNGQFQGQQPPPLKHAQNNIQVIQQGSNAQQSQQRYYSPRQQPQQQSYAQGGFQQQSNNTNFDGNTGISNTGQFPYDNDDYMNPNPYAVSARRAMEDASSFNNQSIYGQFGRR